MLDGLQALLTRQRSFFLVVLFLSHLPAAHLLLRPPPQTFERPFAPRPHVRLSLPKKPLRCDQLAARYFLPVTNVKNPSLPYEGILDRKKSTEPFLFSTLRSTLRKKMERLSFQMKKNFLGKIYEFTKRTFRSRNVSTRNVSIPRKSRMFILRNCLVKLNLVKFNPTG